MSVARALAGRIKSHPSVPSPLPVSSPAAISRPPISSNARTQNQANKQAWDELYASTPAFVWGSGAAGFLEEFLRPELARQRSLGHVLDAGAGEGRNLSLLLKSAATLTACDASPAALAKMAPELKGRVRVAHCDLGRTPFPDAAFDFILLCDTVETLPDVVPVFREMRRILAPGGTMVCNIPGPEGDVAGIDMTVIGDEEYLYRGRYFYRFLRDRDVATLLADTGWQTVRAQTMRWTEPAHPGFRAEPHEHLSRVYLLAPSTTANPRPTS